MLPDGRTASDEFFGNLYHLNAEEEPENPDYPKNPEFKKKLVPARRDPQLRDAASPTPPADAQAHGKRSTRKVTVKALDFMERAKKADKPFFSCGGTPLDAHLHASEEGVGTARPGWASMRRYGRARRPRRAGAREAEGNWGSTTTPSSCTPPTTARKRSPAPDGRDDHVPRREEHPVGGWLPACRR